eukprot:GHVS01086239.1.p1 GENE.GHVS01086239.1~~GHVS01086239.1.p1  ORF type:complete len:129 (+),score=8.54 GHVS01086239.1:35-388(+)
MNTPRVSVSPTLCHFSFPKRRPAAMLLLMALISTSVQLLLHAAPVQTGVSSAPAEVATIIQMRFGSGKRRGKVRTRKGLTFVHEQVDNHVVGRNGKNDMRRQQTEEGIHQLKSAMFI